MRLPFLQVAMEVVELAAPDVAVQLGVSLNEAIGALVRLISWELARCPDHLPPSASASIEGLHVAKLIANAAGLSVLDPEAVVEAFCASTPALLERTATGLRAKGLDRYDEAWRVMQSRSAKGKAAADKRWKSKPSAQPMPQPCSGDAPAMLGACSADAPAMPQHAHIQTQTQTHVKTPPPRAPVGDLEAIVSDVFQQERKSRYLGSHRDAEAARSFFANDIAPEEVATRWRRALRHQGFPTVSTLAELVKFWDHFATDKPPRGTDSRKSPIRAEDQKHGAVGEVDL